ncbi:unnamed protein product [Pedinophyceae sp. YPF-701]|nr:unnamed protein product [Pedinophyceae sp. YPF-701]
MSSSAEVMEDKRETRRAELSDSGHTTEVDAEDEVCWICLDGADPEAKGGLHRPCKCPRFIHDQCLARWQLQSAGTRKEKECEFCGSQLPDWRTVLTPTCGCVAPAIMNVNFNGSTYSFEVAPGEDGYKRFTERIRTAFSLPADSELNITFTCDEPSSGSLVTLQGPGAYDAAVHCACISAAKRAANGQAPQAAPAPPGSASEAVPLPTAPPAPRAADRLRTAAPNAHARDVRGAKKRPFTILGRKIRAFVDFLGGR